MSVVEEKNKPVDRSDVNSIYLDSIDTAIADIAAGKAVIVVDDENRENEGDIIFAADLVTPELLAFTVRYSSGYICVSLEEEDCQRLNLPPMMNHNQDIRGTAYTVTVDATTGIDTGISAQDRARTIQVLADTQSTSADLRRPGHVVPLRAKPGGVLERAGHTEAAIDLAKAAGRRPAGVLCEVVSEDNPTEMARLPELRRFADSHGLSLISIEQIQEYRRQEQRVTREVKTTLPTKYGQFQVYGYHDLMTNTDHVALIHGDISDGSSIPVRLHSECLTGDVFGSVRCDCGEQLEYSLQEIKNRPAGILIYLRGHEGRGIGLIPKLKSYTLQDQGLDTVDANITQGYPADAREYGAAAAILKELGISSIRLMSNNPAKKDSLESLGITVEGRIPVELPSHPENKEYLETKRMRMGHQLDSL